MSPNTHRPFHDHCFIVSSYFNIPFNSTVDIVLVVLVVLAVLVVRVVRVVLVGLVVLDGLLGLLLGFLASQ